jgi:exonuclease VII small subunit
MSERPKGGAPVAGSAGPGAPRGESPLKLDVLDRLEKAIGRLADGTAPLEELVAAHQEAVGLLDEAEAELKALRERAGELSRSMGEVKTTSPPPDLPLGGGGH